MRVLWSLKLLYTVSDIERLCFAFAIEAKCIEFWKGKAEG